MPVTGDQTTTGHTERLWPSPAVWLLAPLLGLGFGAMVFPYGAVVTSMAFVLGVVLVIAALVTFSPRVEVGAGVLRAGRAAIELPLVGEAEGFTGEAARQQRGPSLDARAFLVLRGWVDPVVKVEILDEADPTPYWLISTRDPDGLVEAIRTGRLDSTRP